MRIGIGLVENGIGVSIVSRPPFGIASPALNAKIDDCIFALTNFSTKEQIIGMPAR
jgi:hypothetical protein